jgi:cyclopropane-fatty-acyl-phospholipid synthase
MTSPLSAAQICLQLFHSLVGNPDRMSFRVVLWNGAALGPEAAASPFTLRVNSPDIVADLLDRPDPHTLAEAFVHNDIEIDGDLLQAIEILLKLLPPRLGMLESVKMAAARMALRVGIGRDSVREGEVKSRERERAAIAAHYDHPAEFWKLWLDSHLQYTCAYYPTPDADLETGQLAKLEYVCRKLDVQPGDRVLDLGCGWGGFMTYAARRRGAVVTGVTLSRKQAEYTRQAIVEAGVADRCQVVETDFRDFRPAEPFDKAIGIGILEHVGPKLMGDYFDLFYRVLRPGGRFLNQAIALAASQNFIKGDRFMNRYVFPDAELMPLNQTLNGAEKAGFEVLDVEFLRGHYPRTLQFWRERLEASREAIERLVSPTIYRVFRLYLAACQKAFEAGAIKLYQTLLNKPGDAPPAPVNRSRWYAAPLH